MVIGGLTCYTLIRGQQPGLIKGISTAYQGRVSPRLPPLPLAALRHRKSDKQMPVDVIIALERSNTTSVTAAVHVFGHFHFGNIWQRRLSVEESFRSKVNWRFMVSCYTGYYLGYILILGGFFCMLLFFLFVSFYGFSV